MEDCRPLHTVVIGGGISGLAAAYYAACSGRSVSVIERETRLGGLIQTDRVQGCALEAGPDSFLAAKPSVKQLAEHLGIADKIIGSNDSARRTFIARDGKLIAMPRGMVLMVPTDLESARSSPLFGEDTMKRLTAEMEMPARSRGKDFSIGELVADHFGEEVLTYIAEPLLSGVFGGDPSRLSAPSVLPRFVEYERQLGSLIRGALGESRSTGGSLFRSFSGGMGDLITALEANVRQSASVIRAEVTSIVQDDTGYRVNYKAGKINADEVALCVPAHAAAALVTGLSTELASHFNEIPYSSAILCTYLFDGSSFPHPLDGFGFLVPRPERSVIAAATWINTKFPSRAAANRVALRAFLVDPEANQHLDTSDENVSKAALKDLSRFMGDLGNPVYSDVHRWPKSMPQYVVGHSERVANILRLTSGHPRLHLVSNYVDGVGIPDCIRLAAKAFANP